jgi:hypothetical protein
MAFDFSKYTTDTSTSGASPAPASSIAEYTPGYGAGPASDLDPALAKQLFSYIGKNDSDANLLGEDTKNQLIQKGLLKPITQGGGEGGDVGQTTYELGDNAPTNFEGHTTRTDNTPGLSRIIGADSGAAKDQGLVNPAAVKNDPMWGNVTYAGNKNQHDSMDTFWKVAPFIPSLFAMGAPLLFSGLAGAGGATAGALVGSQTPGLFGGALNTGAAATASDFFASAPAWLTKAIPKLAESGIKGLASGNGKFDFTKYISGLAGSAVSQFAKGL